MLRFLIFAGYFEWMIYLVTTSQMDQYINVHYRYLIYITLVLALFLALIQLVIWIKQPPAKQAAEKSLRKKLTKAGCYILMSFPIIAGLLFPHPSLDANIVSTKGFSFPLSKESIGDPYFQTQYLAPDTSMYFTKDIYHKRMYSELNTFKDLSEIKIDDDNYLEVMELIYDFPRSFANKTIDFTGFFYHTQKDQQNYSFAFRFGIVHCIADAGVYGLLLNGVMPTYKNNQWLNLKGKITISYFEPFKRHLPVLSVTSQTPIAAPKNEYVYLNNVT
ncbi:TIGR03943 family putative permease subunit [Enterococcus faecalis]